MHRHKNTPARHLADASWHFAAGVDALRRARKVTSSQAVVELLDQLLSGQRSVRRIVGRISEESRA